MKNILKPFIFNNKKSFNGIVLKKIVETKNNIIFYTFTIKEKKTITLPYHLLNYENKHINCDYKFNIDNIKKNRVYNLYSNKALKNIYSNYLHEKKFMKGIIYGINKGGFIVGLNGITAFLPKSQRKNFKVHRIYFKYFYYFLYLNHITMVVSRRVVNPNQFYKGFLKLNIIFIKHYRKKYNKSIFYFSKFQFRIFKSLILLYKYILRKQNKLKKKEYNYVDKYFYRNKRKKYNIKLFTDEEISNYNHPYKNAYKIWSEIYEN